MKGSHQEGRVMTFKRIRTIGLLLSLGWMVLPVAAAESLTVEQVVARCAEALGGAGKIASVRTLRITVDYPNRKIPCVVEIKRPNRIRSEADYILVYDGKRCGYLKGAPSKDGRDPGPKLLPAEEGKDFEVDIAFFFPAFFDYPAQYEGLGTVEGREYHKMAVVLPLGIKVTYFLDAKTFIPARIVAEIPNKGVVYKCEHAVGDYARTDGLLFPRTSDAQSWGPPGLAKITSVEVNVPLGDDRFEMPDGLSTETPEALHPVTVPFTLDHNRMIVDAEFLRPDGTVRRARAWVDTGNQFLVLAESLAGDLGLDLSGLRCDTSRESAESSSPAPAVRLGGMPLQTGGIKTTVFRGSGLRPGVPAEVCLPASALLQYHVVFDYPARRLTLALPGALAPRGVEIPCRVNASTGLFQVAADLDGETVWLGVDTGSCGTWVSDTLTGAWQARHPDWPHATGAVGSANFWGFDFEAEGVLMSLPQMGIGPLRAPGVAVLGLDPRLFQWYSKKSAGPVEGFIGANVLKGFCLEIDFPKGLTYWEEGPQPDPRDLDIVGLTLRPEAGGGFTIAGVVQRDGEPAVAGVQPGDALLCVDGLDTSGALMGTVVDALRGEPGAVRTLVIERAGERLSIEARVSRLP
jgi:predicted aspartyl protease